MAEIGKEAATQIANTEKKTGKTLAQWSAEIKSCGKTKHGEIRTWLKESYGLGHGDAKLLAIVQAAFEAAG